MTRVPYGVEFYMFGPPGITITDALGQKLKGVLPSRAYHHLAAHRLSVTLTADYCHRGFGGDTNLRLSAPRQLAIGGQGVAASYYRC